MVSPIKATSVLQSYITNKTKVLDTAQPVATTSEQPSSESSKVIFSLAAREKLDLNLSLSSNQYIMSDTKKDRARERAAEIKQRIEELKGLMILLGDMVPKALLRELKQLANQLKSIANELKEGSAGLTQNAIGETSTFNRETRQQGAALSPDEAASVKNEAAQSDASTTKYLPYQTSKEQSSQQLQHQSQQQRRADQRLLQETAQKLQSLFNRFKALLRKEDNDKEMQKQLGEIEKLLTDTNSIATQLTSSSEVTMSDMNIAISV